MKKTPNLPSIYINMLGGFSITIEDKTVNDHNNQSKKSWNLLEYLITFRNREISLSELIDLIWGEEDISNPSGALKTLLFRSRKLLAPLGISPQLLLIPQRGSYAWNQELDTIVDIDLFEAWAAKGVDSTLSSSEQLTSCLKALELYKGDFLPKSDCEAWVISISAYYHSMYLKTVHQTIHLLEATKDYEKMTDICQKAALIEPYDEDLHYQLIYSLYKCSRQHTALEHYNRTTDMLYSEFAITPSNRFKTLYKIIQGSEHKISTDLDRIQNSLQETGMKKGAFLCEYAAFKDIYQLESRLVERTGGSIYLCLLTLSDLKGNLMEQPFLKKGMLALDESIRISLRRGDVYTRYSVSQYLILLPTSSYENGEFVLQRIIGNFRKKYTRRDMLIGFSLQSLSG